MYNKEIYQDWELHPDATQLEIKYKFFVKFIDVLNVKTLIQKGDSNIQNQLSNKDVIRKWQIVRLEKITKQFYEISDYRFPENDYFCNSNIILRSIFMLGDILNTLKVTNYKSNELEIYYEPIMFKLAQKNLTLVQLEEWVSMLSSRVKNYNNNSNTNVTLLINMNESNMNNVMWFVENLCLTFKDISNWYHSQFAIKDVPPKEKEIIINIMNHMIVYALSDFYIRLNSIQFKKGFHEIYEIVLTKIYHSLEANKFAIDSYKEISIFLSKILADSYINKNDKIVDNFLSIVDVSCSETNKEKIKTIVFALLNSPDEYKKVVVSNLQRKKILSESNSFNSNENMVDSKKDEVVLSIKDATKNLKDSNNLDELQENNKKTNELNLSMTLEEQDELLDELESYNRINKISKNNESLRLKSVFNDTKSLDEEETWGEIISTSKLGGE